MVYSQAHVAAYRKGVAAALAGELRSACPYDSRLSGNGSYTKTFKTKWLAGYDKAKKEMGRRK